MRNKNKVVSAVHTITLIRYWIIVILIHPIICLTTLCTHTQLSACLPSIPTRIRYMNKDKRPCTISQVGPLKSVLCPVLAKNLHTFTPRPHLLYPGLTSIPEGLIDCGPSYLDLRTITPH